MKKSGLILLAFIAMASNGFADTVGRSFKANTKIVKETTAQIMAREKFLGPFLNHHEIKNNEDERDVDSSHPTINPRSPKSATWPPMINDVPVLDGGGNGRLFGVPVNFGGPGSTESPYVPPDSDGDVGLTSVIVCANGRMKSYDRQGNLTVINTSGDNFFASVRGAAVSDPRVVFDRITNRWFLEIIDVTSTDNRICLAVSNQEAIDATTTWTFFQFQQNIGGGTSGFCDYATLGVDANGVYVGSNRFGASFANCDLFAIKKSDLLLATPVLTVTPFRNLMTSSNGPGMFTPWPCTNDDPAATSAFIIGSHYSILGTLYYRRVAFSGGTFSISANASITVPANGAPLAMPIATSATTTGSVSALDLRLFYARVFRNRLTGEVTVHTAQGCRMDAAGVGSATGDRSGARWFNIGNVFSGSATLTSAGTVVDGSASGFKYLTIPSTAMNGQGHQFIGFSMGNTSNSPGVGGAYRLAGDPLVSSPTLITAGANYYNLQSGTPTGKRWGDYSFTMVDPRDMMSMWSFQEYCNANNQWQVRGIKVLAPAPTVTSLGPNSAIQGATTNVVITGTGIFDPDPTYPDHLAVTFGPNVTVNSVTWNSATQATVNVSIPLTAPLGAQTVTLTNPDGQTATGSFTILPNPKPITGTLTLQGYTGPVTSLQFIYEIRDAGTNALIETQTLTGLGAGNTYTLVTTQSAGSYKLRIRGVNRFLARSLPLTLSTTGTSGQNYSLTNGDASADNVVGVADFNQMRAAWGGVSPNAPYDVASDFNGDGVIGVADFNILRASWGSIGDN
jgi:hypothetical protein